MMVPTLCPGNRVRYKPTLWLSQKRCSEIHLELGSIAAIAAREIFFSTNQEDTKGMGRERIRNRR